MTSDCIKLCVSCKPLGVFVGQVFGCFVFHIAKLSRAYRFTKGVSVVVSYLKINDILEDNLPYIQSGCWCIQSNKSELHSRNNFLHATRV